MRLGVVGHGGDDASILRHGSNTVDAAHMGDVDVLNGRVVVLEREDQESKGGVE